MKRFALLFISLVVAVMFIPEPASAATKSMKVYNQVIKSKKIVYCTDGQGIFQVSLKTGKVKPLLLYGDYQDEQKVMAMKMKGKYIYYASVGNGITAASINRVKKNKMYSNQTLAMTDGLNGYVITKDKIYYRSDDGKRVMKLNGTKNKKTKVKAKWKLRNSNAKGYKVITKEVDGIFYSYLKTPKKTYKLQVISMYVYEE